MFCQVNRKRWQGPLLVTSPPCRGGQWTRLISLMDPGSVDLSPQLHLPCTSVWFAISAVRSRQGCTGSARIDGYRMAYPNSFTTTATSRDRDCCWIAVLCLRPLSKQLQDASRCYSPRTMKEILPSIPYLAHSYNST